METGTLKELNVKPGDVVECVESVRERTVDPHHDLSVFPTYYDTSASIFRIISRASDTPKLWRDMTDAEKGALLLAYHEGRVIEWNAKSVETGEWVGWSVCDSHLLWDGDFDGVGFAYRVKPEPVRKTIQVDGHINDWSQFMTDSQVVTHRITFETIDGKPDCSTIKMEETKE